MLISVHAADSTQHRAVMDDFQGSAVLMHTSAQLMALLPSQGPKQLKLQKTAYALAAAAGLQVHEAMPQHAGGQPATTLRQLCSCYNQHKQLQLLRLLPQCCTAADVVVCCAPQLPCDLHS
jgi:hypothetical protein